jgi:predicted metal-dependent peptidase
MNTLPVIDEFELTRDFDRTKSKLFIGSNAAFFGSILCSMEFIWMPEIPTACTDGVFLGWNPYWFLKLPKNTRVTVLMHEIWHVGRLHGLRRGTRDPEYWNYACDIWINNQLEKEKYSFETVEDCWKNPYYLGWVEEDIYDDLVKNQIPPPPGGTWGMGDCDLKEPNGDTQAKNLNTVVKALHTAKASGAGSLPGDTEIIIRKFLEPVVPWNILLLGFFNDLLDEDYTWARPNRRHSDIYLPSRFTDDGRLEHLCYYLDVSGSISRQDVIRFNSEVKHIWETFKPLKLTMILFDTEIQKTIQFTEGDLFNEIQVTAGGGTSFICVREHMMETRPTAAIIFTDLDCTPMCPLDYDVPVIWVATRATGRTVPFGKLIHIRK